MTIPFAPAQAQNSNETGSSLMRYLWTSTKILSSLALLQLITKVLRAIA
jgi:hypothetical protein